MAHTPGPWRLDDESHAHVVDNDYHYIDAGHGVHSPPEWRGFSLGGFMSADDASLIWAAPDLLSIVRRLVALDGGAWNVDRHAADKAELMADAHEAIAKAEGRQS